MAESLQFIYKEEFWFISAFLNTSKVDTEQLSMLLQNLIHDKLSNLTDDDIYRKELKDDLMDMAKNITLTCKWVPYVENFPYTDENSERKYNVLGFFKFDIEYYKNNPSKKEKITPILVQQIPYIVLNVLKEFSKKPGNEGVFFDLESPIYIFTISNKTNPPNISWRQENIDKYKKVISYWTVIYSGQWPDYSEKLFDRRIRDNLSNRLSELHFIYRNSGFIYMAEQNYENFFESYMKQYVLDPTPKMRAVLFALRSINQSLDSLFLKTRSGSFVNIEIVEDKIKNLGLLRGLIQTNLSIIYNELDYNRREHYTNVLKHLITEFELKDLVNRVNDKFKIIEAALQELYLQKSKENQERTEKGLSLLNLLFGAGILADLAGVILIALSLEESDWPSILLHSLIALFIVGILVITLGYYIFLRYKIKEKEIGKAVDAIIEDNEGNLVLIKRKYPPFKDFYALPGGLVEKGENLKHALIREVEEETNLDIQIIKKIGYYDEEGRDPRGPIHSTVYKCRLKGNVSDMKSRDDAIDVMLVPKEKLKEIDLAFDHKKMLMDADIIE
ncbi:MAG: NUDIX domain-containing protein [Candidatus Thorarchaeota archaeon]